MLNRIWRMGPRASPQPYCESGERDRNDLRSRKWAPDTAVVVAHELDGKAQQAVQRHEPREHLAVRALARAQIEIGDHENRERADGFVELGRVNAERRLPRGDQARLRLRAPRQAAARKMRRPR